MPLLHIGIDMARATFATALWAQGAGHMLATFPNTLEGFTALDQMLREAQHERGASAIHLVMEPTGGYELALASFAVQQGWQVSLPNPHHVRAWAKGIGRRAKTDRQDALLLARYGAERKPPRWQPLPIEVGELESLLRRKEDLEQMLRQERNRQHAVQPRPHVPGAVSQSLERVIGALEEELAAVEQAIQEHLRQHSALREAAQRLRSVPGIGPKNVLWVLVLLVRWQTLTAGQGAAKGLVAYAGLDPQPYESGTSVRKRPGISRMGNRALRRRLFLGALGGVRGQNVLRTFYQRLVGRGKAKKLALIAAARKLVVWAWAVFRQHTTFDPARIALADSI